MTDVPRRGSLRLDPPRVLSDEALGERLAALARSSTSAATPRARRRWRLPVAGAAIALATASTTFGAEQIRPPEKQPTVVVPAEQLASEPTDPSVGPLDGDGAPPDADDAGTRAAEVDAGDADLAEDAAELDQAEDSREDGAETGAAEPEDGDVDEPGLDGGAGAGSGRSGPADDGGAAEDADRSGSTGPTDGDTAEAADAVTGGEQADTGSGSGSGSGGSTGTSGTDSDGVAD